MDRNTLITSKVLFELGFTEKVIYPGECLLVKGKIAFEVDTHPEHGESDIYPIAIVSELIKVEQIKTVGDLLDLQSSI